MPGNEARLYCLHTYYVVPLTHPRLHVHHSTNQHAHMGCTQPLGMKLVFSNKLVFLYQRQQTSDIFSSIA